ncbi:MAG TPA: ribonuclease P protein component [Smithellaceae bacterium]|nr:ribonuclease P protein component [Smithellaceae bacterium]HQG95583.1 ribonuclease P protein component [Smithellaceae bacterium]
MKEQSYRKLERIISSKRYRAIYRQGVWKSSQNFTSVIYENNQGIKRLGIAVSKKAGNSVRRNRTKRLLREFFRLNKKMFPAGYDVVLIAKKNIPPLTYHQACEELTRLFERKAKA